MHAFKRFALAALLCATALPTTAQDKPLLEVYTYDSFATEWGPGPALKAGFEAICDCVVNVQAADDGIATLRRLQFEGAGSPADVLIGLDTATAGEGRATGLFADHGLDTSSLDLPMAWTDAQFVPFDYSYFAFVYDKRRLQTPPSSFEELIALPDDFKIVIQDPRSSSPGFGLVVWIAAAYGDRAPEIWAGLKPHVLTMTKGWSEAYNLFLEGEADMVLSYTTSPPYHAVAEDDPNYAFAPFAEGHVAQIEVAGVTKSSDQPELARRFLAYLMSAEAQTIIPTTNWMYPVIDIGDALPDAFDARPDKFLPVDEAGVTTNGRAWIDAALAALR